MKRRELIAGLGSAAAWPLAARAQQPTTLPVVGFINNVSLDASVRYLIAFRNGLAETGHVEGRNVLVEYHWLEGRSELVRNLVAEFIRRRVAVIATPGFTTSALAAKAATATIPIVFGVGEDPVSLGLVTSVARPGGNATGTNFFAQEALPKLVGLLHELLPKATRLAVLRNSSMATAAQERMSTDVQDSAKALGLTAEFLDVSTSREIEDAFFTMGRKRTEALIILPDGYFASRRAQLATAAAHYGIPATFFGSRDFVDAGGLMSYGTDIADMFHQVGAYVGQILKGTKPADLPVTQSIKFEFAINMQTARLLGVDVPPGLLSIADVVIE
jgi:putative ABC transport system substrate-binding protein